MKEYYELQGRMNEYKTVTRKRRKTNELKEMKRKNIMSKTEGIQNNN